MKIFRWLYRIIKSFFDSPDRIKEDSSKNDEESTRTTIEVKYVSEYIDDIPEEDQIEERVVYIIGENEYYWQVAFICPCGCQELIQLNLLPEVYPSWSFKHNKKNEITLLPSINRKVGCASHFRIVSGLVVW